MSFRDKLSAMNATWNVNKDRAPGCPDGVYNFQLQKLELAESQTGKMMLKREHFCLDGEYEGNVERDQIVMGSEFGDRQLAIFIEQMGYPVPSDLGELEDIAAAIMNDAPCYQAQVKKQKDNDFKNIRIISVIEKPENTKTPPAKPAKAPAKAPTAKPAPKKFTPAPEVTDDATIEVGDRVKYEDGETVLEGKVTKIDGDLITFETDSGDPYQVDRNEVTKVTAEEGEAQAADDTSVHLAFTTAHNIEECDDSMTVDQLVEKINQYSYKKSELAPEEITFLESIGGTFEKEAPKPAPKPTPKPAPKPAAKKPAPPAKKKK